jgi:hypothetical protein
VFFCAVEGVQRVVGEICFPCLAVCVFSHFSQDPSPEIRKAVKFLINFPDDGIISVYKFDLL